MEEGGTVSPIGKLINHFLNDMSEGKNMKEVIVEDELAAEMG